MYNTPAEVPEEKENVPPQISPRKDSGSSGYLASPASKPDNAGALDASRHHPTNLSSRSSNPDGALLLILRERNDLRDRVRSSETLVKRCSGTIHDLQEENRKLEQDVQRYCRAYHESQYYLNSLLSNCEQYLSSKVGFANLMDMLPTSHDIVRPGEWDLCVWTSTDASQQQLKEFEDAVKQENYLLAAENIDRLLHKQGLDVSLLVDLRLLKSVVLRGMFMPGAALRNTEEAIRLCDENKTEVGINYLAKAKYFHARCLSLLGHVSETDAALQSAAAIQGDDTQVHEWRKLVAGERLKLGIDQDLADGARSSSDGSGASTAGDGQVRIQCAARLTFTPSKQDVLHQFTNVTEGCLIRETRSKNTASLQTTTKTIPWASGRHIWYSEQRCNGRPVRSTSLPKPSRRLSEDDLATEALSWDIESLDLSYDLGIDLGPEVTWKIAWAA